MEEIRYIKALEQAIANAQTTVIITSVPVLTACAIADKCEFDKVNIGKFIDMVNEAKKDWHVRNSPDFAINLLNNQGKPYKRYVNITILANTLRVIQLMNDLHARISLHKDEDGNLTGVADITTIP